MTSLAMMHNFSNPKNGSKINLQLKSRDLIKNWKKERDNKMKKNGDNKIILKTL